MQVGGDLNGRASGDSFGDSVSLSGDGSRVAIGASSVAPLIDGSRKSSAGQVRVFDLDDAAGAAWVQVGQDLNATTAGQLAGSSVSLSDDGSRVVVGAWGPDGVRVFDLNTAGTTWTQEGAGFAGASFAFRRNVSLSGDGSHVAVGEPKGGNGGVEVFAQVGTPAVWTVVGAAISGTSAGDQFGRSVSLSRDGSRLAVGADKALSGGVTETGVPARPGQVTVYEKGDAAWTAVRPAFNGASHLSRFGYSVSLSADGRTVAGGALGFTLGHYAGQVLVFAADNQALVVPSVDQSRGPLGATDVPSQISVEVEEGSTTAVITLPATDESDAELTHALTGGADQAKFNFDTNSRELTFKVTPDFETPASADESNVYVVEVTATAGSNPVVQIITVTVTNLNDNRPELPSLELLAPEGKQSVPIGAVDADDQDFVIIIVGGADQGKFIIDGKNLFFITIPDFESAADANGDNIYEIDITVDDGTRSITESITIRVTNVNEHAPILTSPTARTITEGTRLIPLSAEDRDGNPITFSLSGGADETQFEIDLATGGLRFKAAPDFDNPTDTGSDNIYQVGIIASDGERTSAVQLLTITITNINEAPEITSAAVVTVDEGDTLVTALLASDAEQDSVTFSVTGGADRLLFEIVPPSTELSFKDAPNFESPSDTGVNNIYEVEVTASDGLLNSAAQLLRVTVSDINDPPRFTSGAVVTVDEGETLVTELAASDEDDGDNELITFSVTGGDDRLLFEIVPPSKELSFKDAPDYETPSDTGTDNIYEVEVTASDTRSTVIQSLTVTVNNLNDNSPVLTNSELSVDEGVASVTILATDADNDNITFNIVGGSDQGKFFINSGIAELTFLSLPDFEEPGDANMDNIYEIDITMSDGITIVRQSITIRVLNISDNPPVVPPTRTVSVEEGLTTAVPASESTDEDGDILVYSIIGGDDRARFTISLATGELTFNVAPDYENPIDANSDNDYEVEIEVTDGVSSARQSITVTVTNKNDNTPRLTSSTRVEVVEGSTSVTLTAFDADGDQLIFVLAGGADVNLFDIDADSGVLSFINVPDFESPLDADRNNEYQVQVTATDGVFTSPMLATIVLVLDRNEAPVVTSLSSAEVDEGDTFVATVTASDEDGDSLTYSISGGIDASIFTINTVSGVLRFIEPPDYETPRDTGSDNVYLVEIAVSDGPLEAKQSIAVTVRNRNEHAPTVDSSALSVDEGETLVPVQASDADGDALRFTVTGGADVDQFEPDPVTGELRFKLAPNFEAPTDAGTNNVYEVEVTVSDGVTPSPPQLLTVTVVDVNEHAPVVTSSASASIAEGTTLVLELTASDADPVPGVSVTFTVMGGADVALFEIPNGTNSLRFKVAPDFESPTDEGKTNVYVVEVRASDGELFSDPQVVTVTVTDANDAPVVTSSAVSVAEGERLVPVVSFDADGNDLSYRIRGGDDQEFFESDQILFGSDVTTGQVRFKVPPDFEVPSSALGSNVYKVELVAFDGLVVSAVQAVEVTVTNVNDNTPVVTSAATATLAENQSSVQRLTATDGDAGDTVTFTVTGGDDAGLFEIDGPSGELRFKSPPDFEALGSAAGSNVYVVQVTAADQGSLSSVPQAVEVTVTNVNDNAPVVTSAATATLAEGQVGVLRLTASDGDAGDTVSFTVTGGDDAGLFDIDGPSGELRFNNAPDFEVPVAVGGGNVYVVEVTASDGELSSVPQLVTVTVTNVNEAPVVESVAVSVAEGETLVPVVAADVDSDDLTFTVTGGDDAGLFDIDDSSGGCGSISLLILRRRSRWVAGMFMWLRWWRRMGNCRRFRSW